MSGGYRGSSTDPNADGLKRHDEKLATNLVQEDLGFRASFVNGQALPVTQYWWTIPVGLRTRMLEERCPDLEVMNTTSILHRVPSKE